MSFPPPILDHFVVDVRDKMDEAVEVYRRLGFQFTPRGKHSLGSINHLAVFQNNYLELLGYEKHPATVRADILQYPTGLNGLVFGTNDSAHVYDEMKRNDVPVQEPVAFFRPVELPNGKCEDARFRVVRLPPHTIPGVRTYFCHHFTRHLVWRDDWRRHPNGAINVDAVTMVANHYAVAATIFTRMFGQRFVSDETDKLVFKTANGRIEIVTPEALTRRFGDAAPEPAGRGEYLAALTIRTAGLDRTAEALARAPGVRTEKGRIVVHAKHAFNATLEFVE